MGVSEKGIRTVPNQRIIQVNKQPTNKENLYTTNNLSAIDEAAKRLTTIGGIKLYIYLAKNQNKHQFALSSSHFMEWSGCGKTAYTGGFAELLKEGYLVKDPNAKNGYLFYDKVDRNNDKITDEATTGGFKF